MWWRRGEKAKSDSPPPHQMEADKDGDVKEAESSPQLDPDQLGMSLLEVAKKGDVKKADTLLLSRADIHYEDTSTDVVCIEENGIWCPSGCTALHWAAILNKVEMITFLLQRGADIHRQDATAGWTALHWASTLGKAESASILLHYKADVECRDYYNNSPLHQASSGGHAQVVAMLLHHNADIHKDYNEHSPLHQASCGGHAEVVAMLLHHNTDIHSKNKHGVTPLRSVRHINKSAVVELLLAAEENFTTTFKWTEECVIDSFN